MDDKLSYCNGCENNFYNGNNHLDIKRCWSLDKAEIVMKKQVGLDDVPPWDHTPIKTLSCYHKNGFWFVNADRTC